MYKIYKYLNSVDKWKYVSTSTNKRDAISSACRKLIPHGWDVKINDQNGETIFNTKKHLIK